MSCFLFYLLLFLWGAVLVSATDWTYTIVSYTVNGDKCINNCVDGKCTTERVGSPEDCRQDTQPAPFYYTSGKQPTFCVSRCGKWENTDYEWCYTTRESNTWDYCSSNTEMQWIRRQQFTDDYGPCKTQCTLPFGKPYYTCKTYWENPVWDYCKPNQYFDYPKSKTVNGHTCIGNCELHGKSYMWCYYSANKDWDRCAFPAQPSPLLFMTADHCVNSRNYYTTSYRRKRGNDDDDGATARCNSVVVTDPQNTDELDEICPSQTLRSAVMQERAPEFVTRTVQGQPDNAVYSYTYLPASTGRPLVPMVIRARIDEHTLKPPRSRPPQNICIPPPVMENLRLMGYAPPNDDAGHIIGYQLGGPSEIYNFVPQNRNLNRCVWLKEERRMRKFVNENNGGSIQMTVVLVYLNFEDVRPFAFSINYIYRVNSTIVEEYDDVICNTRNVDGDKILHMIPWPPAGATTAKPDDEGGAAGGVAGYEDVCYDPDVAVC